MPLGSLSSIVIAPRRCQSVPPPPRNGDDVRTVKTKMTLDSWCARSMRRGGERKGDVSVDELLQFA